MLPVKRKGFVNTGKIHKHEYIEAGAHSNMLANSNSRNCRSAKKKTNESVQKRPEQLVNEGIRLDTDRDAETGASNYILFNEENKKVLEGRLDKRGQQCSAQSKWRKGRYELVFKGANYK